MTSHAGAALTALHRRHQLAVRAQALRDSASLWRTYTPGDRASWSRMVALARPVVAARHAQSSAVAARYFTQMAAVEAGRHQEAVLATALPTEKIDASLAATGLVGVIVALSRGLSIQAAAQTGFVRFAGGVTRLALEGGRATVLGSVTGSKLSTSWVRATSGNACEFCRSLAGEGTAPEVFEAHDHCACLAEPQF